jgi:hypothetical protein
MAITTSVARSQFPSVSLGGLRGRLVKCVFAATDYPTGGYAITPALIGLNEIIGACSFGITNAAVTTGVFWQWNTQTGKLQAFGSNGAAPAFLAEIANAADVSAEAVLIYFVGA